MLTMSVKAILTISCLKQCTNDDTCYDELTLKSMPRVDWSNTCTRDKYVECLNECVNDLKPVSTSECSNYVDAQMPVNTINSQVTECIYKVCSLPISGTTKWRPSWSLSAKFAKSRKPLWYLLRAPIQHDLDHSPIMNEDQIITHRCTCIEYIILKGVACNRPLDGCAYMCHKLAKTRYRQGGRMAFNQRVRKSFHTLNSLYRTRHTRKFWNTVRRLKRN